MGKCANCTASFSTDCYFNQQCVKGNCGHRYQNCLQFQDYICSWCKYDSRIAKMNAFERIAEGAILSDGTKVTKYNQDIYNMFFK